MLGLHVRLGGLTKNGGQSVQGSRTGSTYIVAARAQIYETVINAIFSILKKK
jgi:hypothetical protein